MIELLFALTLFAQASDAERRYQVELDSANQFLDQARVAHTASNPEETKRAIDQAAGAVETSLASLEAMGKPPHKNTKNYKKAELRTRELLRRIEAFLKDASVDDRDALQSARDRVNTVHDTVLNGVMSKKP